MEYFITKYKLENYGWNYLTDIFPETSYDILQWDMSNENYSFHLNYFDRQLYDYFDIVRIDISVFRKNNKFICYVNNEECSLNKQLYFYDRTRADICGFINAMNIREIELNKNKK